jgi:hypothetical protein
MAAPNLTLTSLPEVPMIDFMGPNLSVKDILALGQSCRALKDVADRMLAKKFRDEKIADKVAATFGAPIPQPVTLKVIKNSFRILAKVESFRRATAPEPRFLAPRLRRQDARQNFVAGPALQRQNAHHGQAAEADQEFVTSEFGTPGHTLRRYIGRNNFISTIEYWNTQNYLQSDSTEERREHLILGSISGFYAQQQDAPWFILPSRQLYCSGKNTLVILESQSITSFNFSSEESRADALFGVQVGQSFQLIVARGEKLRFDQPWTHKISVIQPTGDYTFELVQEIDCERVSSLTQGPHSIFVTYTDGSPAQQLVRVDAQFELRDQFPPLPPRD